jgi:hypothetical protein
MAKNDVFQSVIQFTRVSKNFVKFQMSSFKLFYLKLFLLCWGLRFAGMNRRTSDGARTSVLSIMRLHPVTRGGRNNYLIEKWPANIFLGSGKYFFFTSDPVVVVFRLLLP